jgi:hypothetical protein
METVRMTHPDLPGRTAVVPRSAVPTHARAGWQRVVDEPEQPVPAFTKDEATATGQPEDGAPVRRRKKPPAAEPDTDSIETPTGGE